MFFHFNIFVHLCIPEEYEYHISPDGRYAVLEYSFTQISNGTNVYLCRANEPLMVTERKLYLASYSDYGKEIKWLDQSTVFIYGEKMNVFKDNLIIKRLDYF